MRIEIIPLIINIGIAAYYIWYWETGHVLYWVGAVIVTVGLLFMRG